MWTRDAALLAPGSDSRDVLRLALQAGAAAAIAATAMQAIGRGELFLAVISAVLVLQRNRDATLDSAGERVAGAVTGTVVGVLALLLLRPVMPDPLPLLAAMIMMGALAAWKPSLKYGLVAAAGIAVASDQSLWDTTISRTLAIFVGGGIGIAVGFILLAESALSRAKRQLGDTLNCCRRLLDLTLKNALDEEQALSDVHSRFTRSLATVKDTVNAGTLNRAVIGSAFSDAVHGCERLWHALIILDRVGENAEGTVALEQELRERLNRIRANASEALACLAKLRSVPDHDINSLGAACREAHQAFRHGHSDEEEVRGIALIFGLSEVSRNIAEINDAVCAIRAAD